jgi:hypothetical protein
MTLNTAMSKALRELRECAAKEDDIGKLSQLVVVINVLLNVIETRVAELEDGCEHAAH